MEKNIYLLSKMTDIEYSEKGGSDKMKKIIRNEWLWIILTLAITILLVIFFMMRNQEEKPVENKNVSYYEKYYDYKVESDAEKKEREEKENNEAKEKKINTQKIKNDIYRSVSLFEEEASVEIKATLKYMQEGYYTILKSVAFNGESKEMIVEMIAPEDYEGYKKTFEFEVENGYELGEMMERKDFFEFVAAKKHYLATQLIVPSMIVMHDSNIKKMTIKYKDENGKEKAGTFLRKDFEEEFGDMLLIDDEATEKEIENSMMEMLNDEKQTEKFIKKMGEITKEKTKKE